MALYQNNTQRNLETLIDYNSAPKDPFQFFWHAAGSLGIDFSKIPLDRKQGFTGRISRREDVFYGEHYKIEDGQWTHNFIIYLMNNFTRNHEEKKQALEEYVDGKRSFDALPFKKFDTGKHTVDDLGPFKYDINIAFHYFSNHESVRGHYEHQSLHVANQGSSFERITLPRGDLFAQYSREEDYRKILTAMLDRFSTAQKRMYKIDVTQTLPTTNIHDEKGIPKDPLTFIRYAANELGVAFNPIMDKNYVSGMNSIANAKTKNASVTVSLRAFLGASRWGPYVEFNNYLKGKEGYNAKSIDELQWNNLTMDDFGLFMPWIDIQLGISTLASPRLVKHLNFGYDTESKSFRIEDKARTWSEDNEDPFAGVSTNDFRDRAYRLLEIAAGVPKENWRRRSFGQKQNFHRNSIKPKINSVPGVPNDPLEFMQYSAKQLGVSLDFKLEACNYLVKDRIRNRFLEAGIGNSNASTGRFMIAFLPHRQYTPADTEYASLRSYLAGAAKFDAISLKDIDPAKMSMRDFKSMQPRISLFFHYFSKEKGPKAMKVALDLDGNYRMAYCDSYAHGYFNGLRRKDFRNTIRRMLELYAKVPENDWAPIDDFMPKQKSELDKTMDSLIENLFSGQELRYIQEELSSARLRISQGLLSIPTLNFGIKTIGARPKLEQTLMVSHYFDALGILDDTQTTELLEKKLLNYVMQDIQTSPKKAQELLSRLQTQGLEGLLLNGKL